MALLAEPLGAMGRNGIETLGAIGRATLFLLRTLLWMVRPPYRIGLLFEHMRFIGNRSVSIVLLTSTFTGMVLVLQGYNALVRFGSEIYLGPLVALSLIRELGPVLAALMVTARAGSAMSATIAGMRVTEQIDALEVMAVEPVQYLASTRLLAAMLCVPLLVTLFNLTGIGAAYVFATEVLRVDGGVFISSIREAVSTRDVAVSLYKALVFAVLLAWISTHQGFHAQRGARGIGRATTQAVVVVSVLVLAGDYVMTALLL
jgi:phospholipid/cholesterol/gamma-HCH transport system permease protein